MAENLAEIMDRTSGWVKNALPGRVEVVFDAHRLGIVRYAVKSADDETR